MTTAQDLATGNITYHSDISAVFDNSLFPLGYRTLVQVFRAGQPIEKFWLETNSEPTTEQIHTIIERTIHVQN